MHQLDLVTYFWQGFWSSIYVIILFSFIYFGVLVDLTFAFKLKKKLWLLYASLNLLVSNLILIDRLTLERMLLSEFSLIFRN